MIQPLTTETGNGQPRPAAMPNHIFGYSILGVSRKTFDPDCIYIKKWVPELTAFSAKEIHSIENERWEVLKKNY